MDKELTVLDVAAIIVAMFLVVMLGGGIIPSIAQGLGWA